MRDQREAITHLSYLNNDLTRQNQALRSVIGKLTWALQEKNGEISALKGHLQDQGRVMEAKVEALQKAIQQEAMKPRINRVLAYLRKEKGVPAFMANHAHLVEHYKRGRCSDSTLHRLKKAIGEWLGKQDTITKVLVEEFKASQKKELSSSSKRKLKDQILLFNTIGMMLPTARDRDDVFKLIMMAGEKAIYTRNMLEHAGKNLKKMGLPPHMNGFTQEQIDSVLAKDKQIITLPDTWANLLPSI